MFQLPMPVRQECRQGAFACGRGVVAVHPTVTRVASFFRPVLDGQRSAREDGPSSGGTRGRTTNETAQAAEGLAMNHVHLSISRRLLVVTTAILLAGSSLGADDSKPTREAFLGEVLDAKPTAATPKFDDYTDGSYHIEKEDLLKGLTEEAKKRKLTLRAVTIVGPLAPDPLWTSYVVVCIQEGEKVRVNSLVMPHARITGKSTGLVTADRYKKWRDAILSTKVLQKEMPKDSDKAKKNAPNPFSSDVLFITWDEKGKTREVFHGKVGDDKNVEKLFEEINGILKELKKTYPEKKE